MPGPGTGPRPDGWETPLQTVCLLQSSSNPLTSKTRIFKVDKHQYCGVKGQINNTFYFRLGLPCYMLTEFFVQFLQPLQLNLSLVVTLRIIGFDFQQFYVLPTQCIYVFVWISEQTAIISLYNIIFDENHPVVLYQYSVYYEFRREHNNVRNCYS
jgi:hypothetical protein